MAIVDELIAVLGYDIQDEAELRRYEQSIDRLNKRLAGFADDVGKYAGVIAGVLGGAFGALGKSVVETSAEFEGYQTALETIEGSAERARQSMAWISEFAKTTPFEVDGITQSFIALKAYGIDPIANDALRTLGDTAAAMNRPLQQAVEAFADAATGEFERLKEFGITTSVLGDQVTFRWTKNGEDLTRTVQKSSEEIRKFLLENMGDRFNGAMLNLSKTWGGMLSNLSDNWNEFKRLIGDSGFFETIKGHLQSLLDLIGELDRNGTLNQWAVNLSDAFTSSVDTIVAGARRIATHVEFIAANFDRVSGGLKVFGAAIAFLIARAFPLITILTGLVIVFEDWLVYLQGGESVIGSFVAQLQEIIGVSKGVAEAIVGLTGTIVASLATAFLLAPRAMIAGFGKIVIGGLIRLSAVLLPLIAGLFSPPGWVALVVAAAALLVLTFWDEIEAAWNGLTDRAIGMFSQMKDWLLNIDWQGVGAAIMTAIWDGMRAIGASITEWFTDLIPDWAKNLIPGFGEADLASQEAGVSRLQGNLSRFNGVSSGGALITNNRQFSPDQSSTNNITINQTVTQPTDAPAAAARATAQATGRAATAQRAQVEEAPAF